MPQTQPKGIRATRDGGLFIHPKADVSEGSSIRIPQVSTELGAGFGDAITDHDREFAATREPVAHFLTYHIVADVFDKWFIIDDPSIEGGDPKIDEAVQDALTLLKAKQICTKALEYERIYGWSLLVGSFNDAGDLHSLEQPLREGSQLLQLAAYSNPNIQVWLKDDDENSERFGEPIIYKIDRGDGKYLYIHYSRCQLVQTRSSGKGVLDPVWDDLTCGRNIRWGASQWMYRTGGGFPVIKFPPGTTKDKLEEWIDSNAFANLMARTYIGITGDMDFKFEGAQGRALDPQPFFHTNLEQIAAGSGVPEPILRGAQAGALTGSEVNQQQYYKVISRIQASLETTIRWIIDHLAEARQIKGLPYLADQSLPEKVKRWVKHDAQPKPQSFQYTIEWVSAFELTELDEANAENLKEDANVKRLQYMTIDEVRAMNELDPLPNGEGATLQKSQPQIPSFEEGDSYIVTPIQKSVDKSSSSSRRVKEEA
uniref:Anti-CBASS protein Acb1-like N-terminal domain-containing protein n=1 Tax=viral metagenome TaxID=1070528 RepID=A0A6M3XTC4_9ZZZZ